MTLKTWTKCGRYYVHLTSQHNNFLYTGYINTFITLISLKVLKLKVKMNKILIYGFQWG